MTAPAPIAPLPVEAIGCLTLWLRDSTREEHEAVEAAFDLAAATQSRESYTRVVQAFASVFLPLSVRLSELRLWTNLGLSESDFVRTDALLRDVAYLRVHPEALNNPHWLDSFERAIGCAYVLQGSRLGGQTIAREARSKLGLQNEGVEFFLGEGKDTARLWRQFREAVDRQRVDPDEAVKGARETFRLFQEALEATR